MATTDFATTILVGQSPKKAFNAINNPRGWWSEEIEGSTEKLNDEFSYHYEDVHRCKMKLIEVVPGKKVVWLVLDANLDFVEDKSEWTGTTITFEITPTGGQTEVRFTHVGLVPGYECYGACSNAWGSYINGSLRSLIATGKGQPGQK